MKFNIRIFGTVRLVAYDILPILIGRIVDPVNR
jgi:hypothetical protein